MRVRASMVSGRFAVAATTALVAMTVGMAPAGAATTTDNAPPTIVDVGLADGSRVNKTVTLQPVVTDDVAVTRVDVAWGTYITLTRLAAPWTFQVPTGYVALGTVPLVVRAYDAAGNQASRTINVDVDNVAPTPMFASGIYNVHGAAATGFLVSPAPGDDGVSKIELYAGATLLGTATAAPWIVNWDSTGYDGIVTLTARAYDALGNTRSASRDALVDNTGPSVAYAFDRSTGYVHAGGTVWVSAVDRIGTGTVDLIVNGATVGSATSVDYPVFHWDQHAVDGPATVTVRASDTLGNVTEVTRTVLVDNDGPAVTVTPAAGARVRGIFTASVTSIRDTSGFAALEAPFGGTTWVAGTPGSRNVPVDTRGMRDGTYPISWVVFDLAGNATTVRRSVIVDNHAPTVSFGTTPYNSTKITARAADPYGVSRVQLLVNGKVVTTDSTAPYSFTLDRKKYGKTFTVQLRAYDRAGNAGTSSKRTYHN